MSLLPDFDEMDRLAERAAKARGRIKALERMEEILQATYMYEAYKNREYWINGKQPTMTVLKDVYKKVGLTAMDKKNLEDLAEEIGRAYAEWEECSAKLENYRNRISVFQTKSANERKRFA